MRSWRGPLLALAPLLIGLGVYFLYWRGEAAAFADNIAHVVGVRPQIGGFPYRLSAAMDELSVTRGGEAARVSLDVGHSEIASGPFRGDLFVATLGDVRIQTNAAGIPAAPVTIAAPRARASLRTGRWLERLSLRLETATVALPLFDSPVGAEGLELHLRETPNDSISGGASGQAEARIAGRFAFPTGTVAASLPVRLLAAGPLTSLAAWRRGGGVVIDGATLMAAEDAPLAGFDAVLTPLADGSLALSGALATDCPRTVAALLTGVPPGEEFRTRRPTVFSLGGTLSEPRLIPTDNASGGSVRSREPPCPDLRR